MKSGTTKPPVVARRTVEATVPVQNTNHIPTALGPQLEDPRRAATARATSVVVTATLEVVVAAVVAVVAAAEAHITMPTKELVAATITEAEATRTAMSPAVHVMTTTLTIGSTRSIKKRPLKQATSTASPPTPQDFTTYFFLRNSNLSGFPSTTRSKTQFSSSDAMP
jgi:hypothetical protein